jgi:radical SAM superfamily enzyme YgiQ (UPF0313 family)
VIVIDVDRQDPKWADIRHVLIVYPYTYVNPHVSLPPIAAEYLQAGVAEAGCTSTLLDMRFEETDIRAHIEKADLVCLYGFFEDCSMFGKWGIHVIDEVLDQIPDGKPVAAGGTGFGEALKALEHYPKLDVVIEGTPNVPIKELLEAGSPRDVKNLAWRDGDELVRNDRVTHRLSDDVYPRRHLRNPKYDYHVLGIGVDLVRAAMGCNYHCRFCYQYGKDTDGNYLRWQGRSPQSQFQELSEITAPFVFWVDDDMTTDMQALDELCDLLIESDVRKVMIGTGRVDHVVKSDVSVLEKMERAGFLGLAFGVESLRDDTLYFYRKGQSVEMAERAMSMLVETNILLFCNFLLGSPGETEEDMMEYLWFGGRWNVDHLVTNRLRVPEGSIIHRTIYDPKTNEPYPGMERIRGRELKRIKNAIKFGQFTPFRFFLTFLKVHRHRGMWIHPLYFACMALETLSKHTWIEKTRLAKVVLWPLKTVSSWRPFGVFTRYAAIAATPLGIAMAGLYESFDRRFGFSTKVLPGIFDFLSRNVLRKQKERAQVVAGRASVETSMRPAPMVKARV